MMDRRSIIKQVLRFAIGVCTAGEFPDAASGADVGEENTVSTSTRRGLRALAAAQTNEERASAIRELPFGLDDPPNKFRWVNTFEFTWLNTSRPWRPFDVTRFRLSGHQEVIPDALAVLNAFLDNQPSEIRQEEKDSNVVLVGTILAAIGGRDTVKRALPLFLTAVTIPDATAEAPFLRRQIIEARATLHCLVTLCGPNNVVADVLAVSYSKNPRERAAALETLCVYSAVDRYPYPQPKSVPSKPRTRSEGEGLAAHFEDVAIPRVLEVAANDPDSLVRLSALRSLHEAIHGSTEGAWSEAAPHFVNALKLRRSDVEERRALLRIVAEMPVNPVFLLQAFRTYLIDKDDLTKGYAFAGLYHCLLAEPDAVVRLYCDDLLSGPRSARCSALLELESAAALVWGYGRRLDSFPGKINPVHDDRISSAGFLVRTRRGEDYARLSEPSGETDPARKKLIHAVASAAEDVEKQTRLLAARVLIRIGEAVDNALYGGWVLRVMETEALYVQKVLRESVKAIRGDDAALATKMEALASQVGRAHPTL